MDVDISKKVKLLIFLLICIRSGTTEFISKSLILKKAALDEDTGLSCILKSIAGVPSSSHCIAACLDNSRTSSNKTGGDCHGCSYNGTGQGTGHCHLCLLPTLSTTGNVLYN